MSSERRCPQCSTPAAADDRFCSSCGAAIDAPPGSPASATPGKTPGGSRTCVVCGQRNDAAAVTCVSCGSLLQKKPAAVKKERPSGGSPKAFSFFQSWKFTLVIALALVATLVIITSNGSKKDDPHGTGKLSPGEQGMIDEIEKLQKHVADAPDDAPSLLRLANLLQDVRFYDKAVDAYNRYLTLDPKNVDARVDLGTTYFAYSFADSTHRHELVALAQQQIKKAVEINPKHQLAWFNLGIITFHGGTPEEAMEDFRKCIAIDSTTDAAKKAEQFLKSPITN